ncbi:MAG: Apoptosis-inducing factor 1, mitochondrial, partial [Paramarteilia canceri]
MNDLKQLQDTNSAGIILMNGISILKFDAKNHIVYTSKNHKINFKKCLIATGCKRTPIKMLEDLGHKKNVFSISCADDFKRLTKNLSINQNLKVGVLGNSDIDLETCIAIKSGKHEVYYLSSHENNSTIFPQHIWTLVKEALIDFGVKILNWDETPIPTETKSGYSFKDKQTGDNYE